VESEFLFEDNGSAHLVAGGTGAGTWEVTGPGRFSYRIREPLVGADGTVEIDQHAVLDGDAFVSSGLTVVRFADGSTTREVTVRIAARRIA
jgi:hypothetical protein